MFNAKDGKHRLNYVQVKYRLSACPFSVWFSYDKIDENSPTTGLNFFKCIKLNHDKAAHSGEKVKYIENEGFCRATTAASTSANTTLETETEIKEDHAKNTNKWA